jgi:hypothetical protein
MSRCVGEVCRRRGDGPSTAVTGDSAHSDVPEKWHQLSPMSSSSSSPYAKSNLFIASRSESKLKIAVLATDNLSKVTILSEAEPFHQGRRIFLNKARSAKDDLGIRSYLASDCNTPKLVQHVFTCSLHCVPMSIPSLSRYLTYDCGCRGLPSRSRLLTTRRRFATATKHVTEKRFSSGRKSSCSCQSRY